MHEGDRVSIDNMTPQRFGELRAQFHALMGLAPEERGEAAILLPGSGAVKTAVTDALEARRQDVLQEAAQELLRREPRLPGQAPIAGMFRTLAPRDGDALAIAADEAEIGMPEMGFATYPGMAEGQKNPGQGR